ncbi:Esterase [Saliniradius amylolyticus]|uniref:Esterase n=1 Tax=Saliniradius amylolyticus TaxID=2183582 RepID=A0A2S2E0M0_9ALTE|nr:YqiA/YcfP family alpha/beta fold hydrolase [Saliniradius amylolyticus]AWL11082.1 Esterase [Saliniradius amylolyticus]
MQGQAKALIYLHGFLSGPASHKAQQVRAHIEQHHPDISLVIPQLPHYPADALEQVRVLAKGFADYQLGFIGSSMGGFLATHAVREFGGRGVLVNPAVHPHRLLSGLLGEHENLYSGERFTLKPYHVAELEQMALDHPGAKQNLWVLLQQGDETLDYREAVDFYQACQVTVEPEGDHSFVGFDRHLNAIMQHLFD